jgi:hypothetical protein
MLPQAMPKTIQCFLQKTPIKNQRAVVTTLITDKTEQDVAANPPTPRSVVV